MEPGLEKHPPGDPVKETHSSYLSLKPIDLAEISDCQYVASYNWLNDEVPTVVILLGFIPNIMRQSQQDRYMQSSPHIGNE